MLNNNINKSVFFGSIISGRQFIAALICVALTSVSILASGSDNKDVFNTSKGKFSITFIGHGSLMIEFKGKIIHVDPFGKHEDYASYPKADVILLTHHHFDHLDTSAIRKISKPGTMFFLTADSYKMLKKGTVMKNGDKNQFEGIGIEAVPAYNSTSGKEKYHPKGRDNGYVLTIGGKRLYISGDTENIPEMDKLSGVDIAFLSMNQPYTMTPEQAVDAVKRIKPRVFYPYHTGDTDIEQLKKLLKSVPATELRLRDMK